MTLKGEEDNQEEDQEEEGEDDIEPEPEPEPDLPANPDDDGKEKPEYLPFRERDYILRRTYSKFQRIRAVETLGLAAGKFKPNLHTYVLCPGVQYGLGEEVLFDIFRQSWLQDPPFLTCYGHGRNKLPTIHFKDLAMHVKFIIYKLPKKSNYIFAIDHTKNRTQKRLLKAIAEGIGIANIKNVEVSPDLYRSVPDFDLFTLDLWMKPSNIFKAAQLSQDDQADADDNADDDGQTQPRKKLKLDFSWWCQGGIPKNLAKLCKEFNDCRGLKPNRILMTGPPISGLTHYAKKIADFYNVPLISVKDVVEMCKKLEDDLGREVKENLDEQRKVAMEVAEKELEKKRSQGIKGLPEELKEDDVDSKTLTPVPSETQ